MAQRNSVHAFLSLVLWMLLLFFVFNFICHSSLFPQRLEKFVCYMNVKVKNYLYRKIRNCDDDKLMDERMDEIVCCMPLAGCFCRLFFCRQPQSTLATDFCMVIKEKIRLKWPNKQTKKYDADRRE